MSQESLENALRNFGLTEKETEVYIFLAKRGAQKTGQIAKQLKKNKGLVYRILKSLQKKGLVEATLEYPTRYTAVPFEKVIDSFIKSKREELALIEETKKDLLSDWENISQTELASSLERFAVIEGNKKIFHKISQMIKETKNQFTVVLNVSGLFRAEQFGVFDTVNNHPMKSKIHFQFLTQLSKQNLKAIKLLKTKLKPGFDVRGRNPELGIPLFPRIVIRDNEEILLFISEKNDQTSIEREEVCLFTNCKSIIQAFSGVFEDLWRNSTDIKQKIVEIETGKPTPKMLLIRDEETAKKMYYETLNGANKEILIVTSSTKLIGLANKIKLLKEWSENGVSIRIMAPIMSKNLKATHQLLECCEVRHIPVGYTETTIIDDQKLFQFNPSPPDHQEKSELDYFENVLFTNDPNYVKQTKSLLFDIWRKTRVPSDVPLQSISFSSVSKKEFQKPLRKCDRYGLKKMEFTPMGKITEKDVLDKINNAKKNPSKNWSHTRWSDTLRFLGSRAFAFIRPPAYFGLPDIIIGVFQNIEASSFGAENILKVFMMPEMTTNAPYQLVAHAQDNPKSIAYREALLAGTPAGNNIVLVNKDQLKVRVHGNTLFAGWTVPIPLIPSKYVLPPCCILFEGYGDVRSGSFNFIFPSGRKQDCWFNSLESFVSFFHPVSKYVGPGTEGFLDRDAFQISYPPQPVTDA